MSQKGRGNNIVTNRKARHEFHIQEELEAGIVLTGTEVKSLREGKVSLQEAYCFIEKNEVFIRGMNIKEYEAGSYNNHDPMRVRKLLLHKKEIKKLRKSLDEKGLTLIPLRMFFNGRNLIKIMIGLGRGKKLHDKRHDIKSKDIQRELDRQLK